MVSSNVPLKIMDFLSKSLMYQTSVLSMEILQQIVGHFSFDVTRPFISFSGRAISVEVLKLSETRLLKLTEGCSNSKGDKFNVNKL